MFARQLQAEKRSHEGFDIYRDNAKKHPDQWFVHTGMARIYCLEGKFDEAAKEMAVARDAAHDKQKNYLNDLVKQVQAKQNINQ